MPYVRGLKKVPRIRRLEVQGFRAIRQKVPLIFDGKSVLLFGENGTGKSSFVDALEKLFTGKVSTLDGRGLGLSSERQGPHIRGEGSPPRITVVFDDPQSTTVDMTTHADTLSSDVQSYLEAARANLFILRRQQILRFVESQPKERYELLRPFLPLEKAEGIEGTLRQAWERTQVELGSASQEVDRLARDIRHLLSPLKLPRELLETDVVAALNSELDQARQPHISSIKRVMEAIESISRALVSFGDLSLQSGLRSGINGLDELQEQLERIEFAAVVKTISALRAKEAREARVFYETVLEQGARWIKEERRTSCPLCEQSIDPRKLTERVEERLQSMKEILNLRQEVKGKASQLRTAIRSALDSAKRARTRANDLRDSDVRLGTLQALSTMENVLEGLVKDAERDVPDLDLDALSRGGALVKRGSPLREALEHLKAQLASSLASLPSPDLALKSLGVKDKLERVSQAWRAYGDALQMANETQLRVEVARIVFESAQAARKEEVQTLLEELAKGINEFYVQLHPDESHGGIKLEVREAVPESVNLRANFYERTEEDPRAYYSDAHLDTLGLSVFLALRRWHRRQTPQFDLMVLDDVLTSVDTAHSVRLSELLLHEFHDYQVLLTTHDRIWFEHLRDIQARCGVAQSFVNKIIHKWTIDEGPDLREPEDERQAIDKFIKDGSAQGIAVMGGRLLEHVLQEMRYSLRLSVRAKRGELYEIGELWPVFYATVKRDYPSLYQRARKSLDALDVRWPVRNWIGAHRNDWAMNVARNTAIEFATAVADLFDNVFCIVCRRFVMPSATPIGQLACNCGNLIYPAPGRAPVQPTDREKLIQATKGALRDAQLDTTRFFEWEKAEAGREP